MTSAKKNVGVLALCQVFFNSGNSILALTSALVGFQFLGDDKTLATVPVAAMVIGTALATVPASLFMRRVGRRAGFRLGSLIGLGGAAVASGSFFFAGFWMFVAGTFLIGVNTAFGQQYRFAAADVASEDFRGKAISLVLAGGVVAAFVGPEIARFSVDIVPEHNFLGPYLALIVLLAITIGVLGFVDIPKDSASVSAEPQRPLLEIARQPTFVVAALSAVVGYVVMVLLMTATPIAMLQHDLSFVDTKFVIQWHVVAMFAPSFFTGSLMARFGKLNVIFAGVVILAGSVAVALAGTGLAHFWLALFLVGLGWNFMFIGGTTLLTDTYRPSERAKAQALNELLVFGSVAVASLSSGVLLQVFGWNAVNYGALPLLVIAVLALGLLALGNARAKAGVAAD
ncbi:MAG: MFS transporter [Proteobacteria bacterium]|nr:MFS transporter [Pseudomonadota bacterium]MCH8189095.1 MFS transporter [Pseudomonadota bacterium]